MIFFLLKQFCQIKFHHGVIIVMVAMWVEYNVEWGEPIT